MTVFGCRDFKELIKTKGGHMGVPSFTEVEPPGKCMHKVKGHVQAKERGLTRHQTRQHLDFRLLASRTVSKKISIV